MTCIQRVYFFIFSAILLLIFIHIKLCVSSYPDEHPQYFSNHLRHHHIPEKYKKLPQIQLKDKFHSHTITKNSKHDSRKNEFNSKGLSESIHPKIEEAMNSHLNHKRNYHKTSSLLERSNHPHKSNLNRWRQKVLNPTRRITTTPSRVKPINKHKTPDDDDDDNNDYFYYDYDYGRSSNRDDYNFETNENDRLEEDIEHHYKSRLYQRMATTAAIPEHQKSPMTNDYSFDYLDDEPTGNNTEEKSGSLTEEKWRNYGTAEAVKNSRRRYMAEAQIIADHITRIQLEAACKEPKPKIIPINDSAKRYVPHCTVLHRCGDDTGCCHSDIQTCVAKKTTTVELYFYVIPVGSRQAVIETLSFDNHTECHCVYRHGVRLPEYLGENENSTRTNSSCHCVRHFNVFEENITENNDYGSTESSTWTFCRCDCLSDNQICLRLKKGLEGFSTLDRRCISEGNCTIPICQYGEYNTYTGRCPRSQNKRMITHHWDYD